MSCLKAAFAPLQLVCCCLRPAYSAAKQTSGRIPTAVAQVRGQCDEQRSTCPLITVAGCRSCCCLQVVTDATWVCTMHPEPTQRSCKLPEDLGFAGDFSGDGWPC